MVKIVSLFLIGMLVMAMFGKLRLPKLPKIMRKRTIETAQKCSTCGTYKIKNKPCGCTARKASKDGK
ncbi:MAG: hypothetical protein COB84_06965 [Rhodobacteraceae bacterium]|nr:MAG: hypothetical protein COB84_06965 [Paracoccaceae bacterium]